MARLFLAYSSSDRELAGKVSAGLQLRGHQIEIDVDSLVPGVDWRRELSEKLSVSDGLVVLLTPNALASPFVMGEIGAVRASSHRFLVPVVVGPEPIPAIIGDLFAIQLPAQTPGQIRRAVDEVDEAVRAHLQRRLALRGLDVPAGYEHLTARRQKFGQDVPFERSVFVMMKFPDASMRASAVRLLDGIWHVIGEELDRRGLQARRADVKDYHDELWDNVCIYMIGCKYGIAVRTRFPQASGESA